MILAGDIGGTNARLALFEGERVLKKVADRHYPSREYSSLLSIVLKFLEQEKKPIDQACFALAGPVQNGKCKMTNLSWIVDSNELKRELKVKDVILMNDLEANAWGLRVLKQEDFYLLHAGTPGQTGNAALLSAGTGLGEAGLYWDGMEHRPFACEGGHTDFAPRNALEVEFFAYLTKLYPSHISYERVISGQGLVTIFRFLVETGREIPSQEVKKEMESRDPAAVISEWGNKQRDRACTHALEWFVSFYGAEAGNMALKLFSLGGVYLGGGIAPQILDTLKRGLFMKGFLSKGRFESLLKTMPIRIVLNDDAALLGAAEFIRRKK